MTTKFLSLLPLAASVGMVAAQAPASSAPAAPPAGGASSAAPSGGDGGAAAAPGGANVYSNSIAGVYTVTQDTGGDIPLVSKHFEWPQLPYQADTGDGPRGIQQGYNICNSTTQNQDSMCQTLYFNSATDFCLWGAPAPNSVVGDVEGEMVAYCTKPDYGGRLITEGAITGLQFIKTPDYIEVVGFIDQTKLNLTADDTGGEEDPHGADHRGNALGALLYSNAFGNTTGNQKYTQVEEWSYFIGGGIFCFKACDPAGQNDASLCQHVYDESGCSFNDPADYGKINGTFESCKGENQLPPGYYVEGGVTQTWVQGNGPIPSAMIPATSECSSFTSSVEFSQLFKTATPTAGPSGSNGGAAAGSGSGSGPAATGSSGDSDDSGALTTAGLSTGVTISAIVGSMMLIGAALL